MQISMRNLNHNLYFKIHPHILHRGSPEPTSSGLFFYALFIYIFQAKHLFASIVHQGIFFDEMGVFRASQAKQEAKMNNPHLYFLYKKTNIPKENPKFEVN